MWTLELSRCELWNAGCWAYSARIVCRSRCILDCVTEAFLIGQAMISYTSMLWFILIIKLDAWNHPRFDSYEHVLPNHLAGSIVVWISSKHPWKWPFCISIWFFLIINVDKAWATQKSRPPAILKLLLNMILVGVLQYGTWFTAMSNHIPVIIVGPSLPLSPLVS